MPAMSFDIRRPARLLAALLLGIAALPAVPQSPDRYIVEVVVFRAIAPAAASGNAAPLPAASDEVVPETSTSRKLSVAANRLRNSGNYRILAHTAWVQSPSPFESRRGVSAGRLGMAGAGITGKFMFERGGRYLHLGLDLAVEDGGNRYRLSEYRKQVKIDEAQYFDNAGFGVLAILSPAN